MAKQSIAAHKSWLPDANHPTTDFPLTHLPYGAFSIEDQQHLCVAIGTHLLDLHACATSDLLPPNLTEACQSPTLNLLMSQGSQSWALLRKTLTTLLHADAKPDRKEKAEAALHSIAGTTFQKPVHIPNYTDFYASIHHATRVGQLFRPDQPLLPNYKHIPIGYHGRASSILISGEPIVRPTGQTRPSAEELQPNFLPTSKLDYELELALYIGQPSTQGHPVPISAAADHLFGLSLLNDWSARDIQSWEYQPLGPFLAKNFATTISPWVTPMAALEPFRVPAAPRPATDPKPLPYLHSAIDQKRGNLNALLEVSILTKRMKANKLQPFVLSESNPRDLYWTPAQLIAHHTSNGCNLQVGDILATGTISGPAETSAGCLLELTRNGAKPLLLPTGETRTFLEDGDEIILRGSCTSLGHPRIGLGECRATILPARTAV
ncbi:fumarylacetoacetase [Tunturiibacter empetritectus]|uniref:fumarylacetoacetase n=1 Tax=Tunturiibacter lichenicola TaxID=2051959 RepID=A0A852VDA3_9BACT|nr:fumarylacetoacetase [Edaphobacter lichenicola]NYF89261.1 fumarylacetoacetase [Edaphobacter lichenicola]